MKNKILLLLICLLLSITAIKAQLPFLTPKIIGKDTVIFYPFFANSGSAFVEINGKPGLYTRNWADYISPKSDSVFIDDFGARWVLIEKLSKAEILLWVELKRVSYDLFNFKMNFFNSRH